MLIESADSNYFCTKLPNRRVLEGLKAVEVAARQTGKSAVTVVEARKHETSYENVTRSTRQTVQNAANLPQHPETCRSQAREVIT